MIIPEATVVTAGPSGAEARVASDALESGVMEPVVPEGQTALPEVSQSMVGAAVRPRSPPVVPRATAEENEVEEIERAEPQPQAV